MDQKQFSGILILAAGNSSRLGRPKQLLEFNGKTLLRHVSEECLEVSTDVVVVTGAFEDQIRRELNGLPVHFVHNPSWAQGMGGSIAAGLKYFTRCFPEASDVTICVSDQPYLSRNILRDLHEENLNTGKTIIASSYGDSVGSPVLFQSIYFEELQMLTAGSGAKTLLSKHKNEVGTIAFPLGNIDIDTQEDYESLIRD